MDRSDPLSCSRPGAVGVLLFDGTRAGDLAAASEAARIAVRRGCDLVGLQVQPSLVRGLIIDAGFEPLALERAEILDSREAIRSLFEKLDFGRAPVVLIDRPPIPAAARAAVDMRISTVVTPPSWGLRLWRSLIGDEGDLVEFVTSPRPRRPGGRT